jgi:hypothetical protein
MDMEFFEPAEAAALMRCSEGWLRDGAAAGRFPHACWGKGKIVFTSEHIAEIARLSEILPSVPSGTYDTGRRNNQHAPHRHTGPQASGLLIDQVQPQRINAATWRSVASAPTCSASGMRCP